MGNPAEASKEVREWRQLATDESKLNPTRAVLGHPHGLDTLTSIKTSPQKHQGLARTPS